MAASITISNTFATQAGPIPLSQLDTNYSQLVTAFNTLGNFANYYADSSGSANALVVTVSSPQLVSYAAGLTLFVKVANTNTGASTINVNALGAKSITTPTIGALSAGDLIAGAVVQLTYDGTQFQLGAVGSFTALRATTLAVSGATTLSSNVTATATSGIALAVTTSSGGEAITATDGTVSARIAGFASSTFNIGTTSAHSAYISTNGVQRFGANSTGNVSINAPNSNTALTVNGQSGANIASCQSAATSDAGIIFGVTSSQQWNLRVTYSDGSFRLYDQTRVAYPLIVSNAGNVTIAAPSSNTALAVAGLNTARTLSNTCTSAVSSFDAGFGVGLAGGYWNLYTNGADPLAIGTGGASQLALYTNGSPRIYITSAGNVGIGTASPSQKLTVAVSDTTQALSLQATTGRVRVRPYVDATNGAILESVDVAETSYLPLSFVGSTIRLTASASSGVIVLGTAAGTAALRLDTTATNAGTQTATWTAPNNKPGAASGVVSRWIPVNLDGTVYYVPAWT